MTIKLEEEVYKGGQLAKSQVTEEMILPDLILSYLVHHAHTKTVDVFLRHHSASVQSHSILDSISYKSLHNRTSAIYFISLYVFKINLIALTELVLSGEILGAIELVNKEFPWLIGSLAYFQLHCQQFIELIRLGDANGALHYAEVHLAPEAAQNPTFANQVQLVIALLAYANPFESPVSDLLAEEKRSGLAQFLNAQITGEPLSKLELALRQTLAVTELLQSYEHPNKSKDFNELSKLADLISPHKS